MDAVQIPKWWLVIVGAAIGSAAVVIGAVRARRVDLPPRLFLIGSGAFASTLVVSVAVAPEQVRAVLGAYSRWNGVATYLGFITIAVVASIAVTDPNRRRTLESVIVWTAVVVAAYALLQRAGLDPLPWDFVYVGSPSFLGNPNFASSYIGITVPLLVVRVLGARDVRARARWLGLILVLVGGIVATHSYLGVAALILGTAVLGGVTVATSERRLARPFLLLTCGGVVVLVGALAAMWTGALSAPYAVGIRLYYWRAALGMVSDFPIFGVGFGRFEDFFRRYRPPDGMESFGVGALADNPHSVPFTMLAEGGLLVGLGWVVFFACVLVLVVRHLKVIRGAPIHERLAYAAWVGLLVAYLAQAAASFDVVSVGVLGYVIVGTLVAMAGSSTRVALTTSRTTARAVEAVAVAAALAVLVLASLPVSANLDAGEGRILVAQEQLGTAVQMFDLAASTAWWEPRYVLAAAQAAYLARDLPTALERFETTARRFPEHFQATYRSGRTAAELGQFDRAAEWYRRALVLEPNDQDLRAESEEVFDLAEDS